MLRGLWQFGQSRLSGQVRFQRRRVAMRQGNRSTRQLAERSREASNSKHQMTAIPAMVGARNLGFLWSLELGAWSLSLLRQELNQGRILLRSGDEIQGPKIVIAFRRSQVLVLDDLRQQRRRFLAARTPHDTPPCRRVPLAANLGQPRVQKRIPLPV